MMQHQWLKYSAIQEPTKADLIPPGTLKQQHPKYQTQVIFD